MGTRADFYIRKENEMTWLGSVGLDGYPDGIANEILTSTDEVKYSERVTNFLSNDGAGTLPESGWPWPWNDSRTTDYSYIFENGKVMCSCFGYPLFDPVAQLDDRDREDNETKMENFFPDMKHIKNVQFGAKSGAIFITGSGIIR